MRTLTLEIRARLPRHPSERKRGGRTKDAVLGALAVLLLLHPWARPRIVVDPLSVVFGPAPVGSPSGTQVVGIGNHGSGTLHLGKPVIEGDEGFTFVTDCGQGLLAPGGSCALNVVLTPNREGARMGRLTIPSDGSEEPLQVSLVGSGIPIPTGRLEPDPSSLDFEQPPGEIASRTVVLRSTGEGRATITSVATDAASLFRVDEGCKDAMLANGESCVVNVAFQPESPGESIGWLIVRQQGQDQEVRIPLLGLARAPSAPAPAVERRGQLEVTPREGLEFRDSFGKAGEEKPLEISNLGDGPLQVLSADLSSGEAAFAVGTECSRRSLAPGETCTVGVRLVARDAGAFRGTLVVRSDDRSIEVPLIAEIREPERPRAVLDPVLLILQEGGAKRARGPDANVVTLTNGGGAPLHLSRYGTSEDGQTFITTGKGLPRPCREDLTLDPKESCQLRVLLRPEGIGPVKADLQFFDDAVPGSQRVALVARRYRPTLGRLEVGPFDENFGPVTIATSDKAPYIGKIAASKPAPAPRRTISLRNLGPGPLSLTLSEPGDPDFRLAKDGCEGRVFSPGEGCEITVLFLPHHPGVVGTSVTITHDGVGGSLALDFQGQGVDLTSPHKPFEEFKKQFVGRHPVVIP